MNAWTWSERLRQLWLQRLDRLERYLAAQQQRGGKGVSNVAEKDGVTARVTTAHQEIILTRRAVASRSSCDRGANDEARVRAPDERYGQERNRT